MRSFGSITMKRACSISARRTSKDSFFLEELSKLGRAKMADYMRVGPDGDPVLNFAGLSRDRSAALVEVSVEVFMHGCGEDAREVRKVRRACLGAQLCAHVPPRGG
jgi:hypothetical protein